MRNLTALEDGFYLIEPDIDEDTVCKQGLGDKLKSRTMSEAREYLQWLELRSDICFCIIEIRDGIAYFETGKLVIWR